MVRHTQTIRGQQPTNCLSLFGHFMGLALRGRIFGLKSFLKLMHPLLSSHSESTHIKQAFEGEFPKALHILNDFWSQISPVIESSKAQVSQSLKNSEMKIGFHSDDKK